MRNETGDERREIRDNRWEIRDKRWFSDIIYEKIVFSKKFSALDLQ